MCPIATSPGSAWSCCSLKTCATSPMSRTTVSRPPSETAIPADSWPRCWSANRPKYARRATSRSTDRMPKRPHIRRSALPGASQVRQLHSQQGTAPGDADAVHRHSELRPERAHLVPHLRRTREHGASSDLAEERERVVVEGELRAAAGEERRFGETDREPALGRVVDERAARSDPPQERDEPCLGREIERARAAADLAVERLELRAGEREWRRLGDEQRVAVAPALRDEPHVGHEADRADDRSRVDRAAVRLVVERDVARRRSGARARRRRPRGRESPRSAPTRRRASPGSRS